MRTKLMEKMTNLETLDFKDSGIMLGVVVAFTAIGLIRGKHAKNVLP